MLQPGQFVDRYRVDAVIGEGAMAMVYRVRHATLGSMHALKVINAGSPALRARLIEEGRTQATLRHPNIVAVTDVLEVNGEPALVMEFVDGPTLAEWLEIKRPALAESLDLFRGVIRGIRHAHSKGLVHRDLKPANVMLAPTDDGLMPKVADFGLAKTFLEDEDGATRRKGLFMGTPRYTAPEQIRDASNVDRRADMFSLGCMLYELVTGRPPFDGPDFMAILHAVSRGSFTPARTVVPGLPAPVDAAITALLRVDPEQRLQTCQALLDLIEAAGILIESPTGEHRPVRPAPARDSRVGDDSNPPLPPDIGSTTWMEADVQALLKRRSAEEGAEGRAPPGAIGRQHDAATSPDDVDPSGTLALQEPVRIDPQSIRIGPPPSEGEPRPPAAAEKSEDLERDETMETPSRRDPLVGNLLRGAFLIVVVWGGVILWRVTAPDKSEPAAQEQPAPRRASGSPGVLVVARPTSAPPVDPSAVATPVETAAPATAAADRSPQAKKAASSAGPSAAARPAPATPTVDLAPTPTSPIGGDDPWGVGTTGQTPPATTTPAPASDGSTSGATTGTVRVKGDADTVLLVGNGQERVANGTFSPGSYEVKVWFKGAAQPVIRGTISVEAGKAVTINCSSGMQSCRW